MSFKKGALNEMVLEVSNKGKTDTNIEEKCNSQKFYRKQTKKRYT